MIIKYATTTLQLRNAKNIFLKFKASSFQQPQSLMMSLKNVLDSSSDSDESIELPKSVILIYLKNFKLQKFA